MNYNQTRAALKAEQEAHAKLQREFEDTIAADTQRFSDLVHAVDDRLKAEKEAHALLRAAVLEFLDVHPYLVLCAQRTLELPQVEDGKQTKRQAQTWVRLRELTDEQGKKS